MRYIKALTLFCLILSFFSCGTIKEGFTNKKKTSMDKPPPPGTTSVEKFIENMTVSLGF